MTCTIIAKTIVKSLGGNRFIAMTGARDLVNSGDALSFKLPAKFAKDGINNVKISYDEGVDLFDMSFDRIYGGKMTNKARVEGVYVDMVGAIFTQETGLDTHL